MKILSTTLIIFLALVSIAQRKVTFDDYQLSPESFNNASDDNLGFRSEPFIFPNNYDTDFDAFTGFAVSNITDNVTPGFSNQYASMAGAGAENTENYAVAYSFSGLSIETIDNQPVVIDGVFLNNNAFAYYSMLNGDAFAKRFGGVDGSDPDYFRIDFKGFLEGQEKMQGVSFYLADFRFENNDEDYIVSDWTWVDLSELGQIDRLELELVSTDIGDFGMNTPAYFCLDQLKYSLPTGLSETLNMIYAFYPNPVKDILKIETHTNKISAVEIRNALGNLVFRNELNDTEITINISEFPKGLYSLTIFDDKFGFTTETIVHN